ncbi:hypothetical protein evm_006302 [Chilo suppressalis]|nr:hypothetical protein evm_006302 [Chilo suppressalis]
MESDSTEIYVKAPWGNIAGLTWGDSSLPPVLLVHGKLDVCSSFRSLVALLPRSFYYVAIDLPGNGRSDPLPRGVRFTVMDYVPVISIVKDHYDWEKFMYVAHSFGTIVGKIYNIAYPEIITRVVELDPVPAYHTWPTTREGLRRWYHRYYDSYEPHKYHKFYGGLDGAPKYTYEKAQEMIMSSRSIPKEATENVLERCLEPAGDGLYRFTYDQRMKEVTILPFSGEHLRRIYTTCTTPTFAVLAQSMIDIGLYETVPFITDADCWPYRNYSFKIVDGGHDLHLNKPEAIAEDISKFLMAHLTSKL